MAEIYAVGGMIRDQLLGINIHDRDYVVTANSYEEMKEIVKSIGGDIRKEDPEYLTLKAVVNHRGVDFAVARREGSYADGRRPTNVVIGSILEDLARRDFTMNAIAMNIKTGEILDPYNGQQDISEGIIRCVRDARNRITEDYLRLLRAARFSVTKNMWIHDDINDLFYDDEVVQMITPTVKIERIRDEVFSMFRHNTWASLEFFSNHTVFMDEIFHKNPGLWLEATLTQK